MDSATRYTLRRNTATMMKIFVQIMLRCEETGSNLGPDLLATRSSGPRPADTDGQGMGGLLQ